MEYFNNIKLADDIVLLTKRPTKLQEFLKELKKSHEVGFKINFKKVKVMFNSFSAQKEPHLKSWQLYVLRSTYNYEFKKRLK